MRAMVVIGDSYNHCGALDVALRWHEACRRHAVSYGDDTQISGLIFNQVAFRAVFERFNQCFAHERGELSRKWALHGLDSSANYDEGIGLASHPALLPTLRAQVLVTEGRYAEALELFDRHMRAAMHQGMAMFGASYLADIAWCEFNLAHVEAARQTMRAVEGEIKRPTGDHEDRAVTHRRMATMYERLGESEGQARHAHYALKHFHAHVADEDRMRALMNRYFADLSPNEMECPALVDD
jgi:hypothetical protein